MLWVFEVMFAQMDGKNCNTDLVDTKVNFWSNLPSNTKKGIINGANCKRNAIKKLEPKVLGLNVVHRVRRKFIPHSERISDCKKRWPYF